MWSKPESAYRLEAAEAALSETLKGRPGVVQCSHCAYIDYPAWVRDHERRSHPDTRLGYCRDCGGHGVMVVTAEGLFHRYGQQCDAQREAEQEARLLRAIEDGPEF